MGRRSVGCEVKIFWRCLVGVWDEEGRSLWCEDVFWRLNVLISADLICCDIFPDTTLKAPSILEVQDLPN